MSLRPPPSPPPQDFFHPPLATGLSRPLPSPAPSPLSPRFDNHFASPQAAREPAFACYLRFSRARRPFGLPTPSSRPLNQSFGKRTRVGKFLSSDGRLCRLTCFLSPVEAEQSRLTLPWSSPQQQTVLTAPVSPLPSSIRQTRPSRTDNFLFWPPSIPRRFSTGRSDRDQPTRCPSTPWSTTAP